MHAQCRKEKGDEEVPDVFDLSWPKKMHSFFVNHFLTFETMCSQGFPTETLGIFVQSKWTRSSNTGITTTPYVLGTCFWHVAKFHINLDPKKMSTTEKCTYNYGKTDFLLFVTFSFPPQKKTVALKTCPSPDFFPPFVHPFKNKTKPPHR